MITIQFTEPQARFLHRYMSYFKDFYEDPEDFYEDFTERGCSLTLSECLDVSSLFFRKLHLSPIMHHTIKAVTVKEFIKKLQEYPEDYEVCVPDDSGYFLLSPDIKVDGDTIIIYGIDSLQ